MKVDDLLLFRLCIEVGQTLVLLAMELEGQINVSPSIVNYLLEQVDGCLVAETVAADPG